MPFGGGTFTIYDKNVPGVYVNVQGTNSFVNSSFGVVGLLVTLFEIKDGATITKVTKDTYSSVLIDFITEEESQELYHSICEEIFQYAHTIYLIPFNHNEPKNSYTVELDDLLQWITPYPINVIVGIDVVSNGFGYTNEENPGLIFSLLDHFLTSTNKRIFFVLGVDNDPFFEYLKKKDSSYQKWIITPSDSTSEEEDIDSETFYYPIYFIAGVFSSLQPGESLAGIPYSGNNKEYSWMYCTPKTIPNQEQNLLSGFVCYYSLGEENNLYILKDITFAHQRAQIQTHYNESMGQIVRLEKYIYDFLSDTYTQSIHGKPNTAEYREVIKGILLEELRRLESISAIEEVSSDHVKVEKVDKNAILITVLYKPISGIDYVYVQVKVE